MQASDLPVRQLFVAEMVHAKIRQAIQVPQWNEAPQQRQRVEMTYVEAGAAFSAVQYL